MLNRSIPAEETAYQELLSASKSMTGVNFALLMRHDDALTVHRRENQPCQGGEMRKYAMTYGRPEYGDPPPKALHPNCTRPQDYRPADLRHPFPNGIPEGVSRCYLDRPRDLTFMQATVSVGPYQKIGLGGTEFSLND